MVGDPTVLGPRRLVAIITADPRGTDRRHSSQLVSDPVASGRGRDRGGLRFLRESRRQHFDRDLAAEVGVGGANGCCVLSAKPGRSRLGIYEIHSALGVAARLA